MEEVNVWRSKVARSADSHAVGINFITLGNPACRHPEIASGSRGDDSSAEPITPVRPRGTPRQHHRVPGTVVNSGLRSARVIVQFQLPWTGDIDRLCRYRQREKEQQRRQFQTILRTVTTVMSSFCPECFGCARNFRGRPTPHVPRPSTMDASSMYHLALPA